MAGVVRTRLASFVFFDAIGAALWAGAGVLVGWIFRDAVVDVLAVLEAAGRWGIVALGVALLLWLGVKEIQRQRLLHQLRMARVSVEELQRMLEAGKRPLVVDVRSAKSREQGTIPGSRWVDMQALDDEHARPARDRRSDRVLRLPERGERRRRGQEAHAAWLRSRAAAGRRHRRLGREGLRRRVGAGGAVALTPHQRCGRGQDHFTRCNRDCPPRRRGTLDAHRPSRSSAMTTEPPHMNWIGIDPAEWLRNWQTVWRLAPDNLAQSILQGWTLNINSNNSAAPQTEVDVLARYSYGRQLGRLCDVVEALLTQSQGKKPNATAIAEFLEMKRDIDTVKAKGAERRVARIAKDLQALKQADAAEFERTRAALRRLLAE